MDRKPDLVMATIKEYFQAARREKATDIYFSVGSPPFLKINGALKPIAEQEKLNKGKMKGLMHEVLSNENWSEFESRGEFMGTRIVHGLGRLRMTLSNERKGPSMVCRLIPLNVPEFDNLGLPSHLKTLVSAGTGLILIMGCAGSGKTTTVASLIQQINNISEKAILNMGTPMEYGHKHNRSFIAPIHLPESGMGLNKSDYNGLIATADIMIIDGLPLEETITPALTATAKGLLVLATLETNGGVAEVLARIIHSASAAKKGYRRSLLAHMLRGAIWQHLLPLTDGSGHTPVIEVLLNDPAISRLIRHEGNFHLLRPTMAAGRYKGMQTMHQALEALKQKSLVRENILAAFENEILKYYVSPIKGSF